MSTPPGAPKPPGRPAPDGPQRATSRGPLIPAWLWWVLLAATLGWTVFSVLSPQTPPTLTLSYTAFLDEVKAGNVASVTISGQAINGTFKKPVPAPSGPQGTPRSSGISTPSTPAAIGTTTPPVTYTRFTTVIPPSGDPRLLPLLEEKGVIISAKDTSGGSFLVDLLIAALPVLVLVVLVVLMARQARRGQQTLFGFGGSKARLYDVERPGITFAEVAGEEEAKAELMQVVDFLKEPGRYRALGAHLPRGVLLIGPPGTGKTLLARAVAGEARVPFFSITGSEFVEMFVGVGASRVRDLFTKAKAEAPSIIFVDEIDAVGRQRGTGVGGGNDEREQTLNQLLAEMDGFDAQTNVMVMAATNRPDVLDPALLRPGRFDRQVTVGLPDRPGREAILKIHTRPLRLATNVDLEVLSRRTPGFSGADLANLANEAALSAARRGATEVHMQDFDEALDKIVLGTRQATIMNMAERRMVAYHEGGHALVAKLTPGTDPVNKVTIIPHGRALGVTEQLPQEERHSYPRDYLLNRLSVMLGGRAAEELVFKEPTTGAESDLKGATDLARRIAGLWGMSDELGPVSYGIGETHPFLGREIATTREYAEATAAKLDAAVRKLIEQAHERACKILTEHRGLLDALANELVSSETVDGRWIDDLLTKSGVPTETSSSKTLTAEE